MPRTRTPALVALVAIVVMPAAAEAGTVRAEPDGDGAVLAFSAAPGEANRLTLRADAGAIVVTDEVPLHAGAGCTAGASAQQARCGAEDLTAVAAALGDGADTASASGLVLPVRLRGEAGDDVLTGGTGADELSGGDGQDTLDYRDRTGGVCLSLWTEQRCYPGEPEGDAIGHDVERILLGDGPDMIYSGRWETPIAVYGGDGNDDLNVGGGHHVVSSGPGDDIVTVAGGVYGWADYVECSAGADKVYALWSDYVADDCETVQWASYYGYDMPWDATDRAGRDADSWWINPATFTVPPPLAAGEPPDNWAERRKAYPEAHGLAGDVPAPAMSALRGRGLAVGVQCAQACAFDARLTVSRATARRHRLGGTVIARTAGTRRGDQARIRLRPRAAVRRRLGKVRRLAVTLRLKAAGRPAAVQRLTLRG